MPAQILTRSYRPEGLRRKRVYGKVVGGTLRFGRRRDFRKGPFLKADFRSYALSLSQSFRRASDNYPAISVNQDVMMGAPCISGTRIPVYMILEALEVGGNLSAAISSYPRLTAEQVRQAVGFAKSVIECPFDDETAPAS